MKWTEENGLLTREFEFGDFISALHFVNEVGSLAEEAKHHPDVLLHQYRKVKIMLKSHDADAITDRDHRLARAIDALTD